MRSFAVLTLLPLLAAAAPSFISDKLAPLFTIESASEIPNSYIVVFKKHVTESSADNHHIWLDQIHNQAETQRTELRKRDQIPINDLFKGLKHKYNIAGKFLGYSGHFDDGVIDAVRKHPDVEFVEKDSIVHTLNEGDGLVEQQAPWGLARISHRSHLNFGNFNKYLYADGTGKGVDVYVIDTGTNIEHDEFEGRASWGKTIPTNDVDDDGNGHGTHCSGTIAGKKYGVAKEANIIAVKVLASNGSGSMSDVVKGVDYATNSHLENVKNKKKGFKGSVANMSLGGGKSTALDNAVNGAVSSGVHFAVAAGNDNADSCKYSPAAAELAITVGASTLDDDRAYFSNYGKCNDIFAPGLNIMSSWIGSKHAVNTISGTSMASPHIAGLVAYYLSLQPDTDSDFAVSKITPEQMKKSIITIGTKNSISNVPSDTSNVLAWNGGGKSNFSAIVGASGYSFEKKIQNNLDSQLSSTNELLKDAMENNFEAIAGTIISKVDSVAREVLSVLEENMQQGNPERSKKLSFTPNEFLSINQYVNSLNHAYTAANLAYNRAQVQKVFVEGEFSPNLSSRISDGKSYHLPTDNNSSDISRQRSVRFSGANAVRPRKSTKSKRLNLTQYDSVLVPATTILNRSNSTNEFSSRRLLLSDRTSPLKTITKNHMVVDTYDEYYTNEQDLPSNPSSYRRIQKSKSMFCPLKTKGFPYSNRSMEILQDQSPTLSNSLSVQTQSPRTALTVSRSTDYLWAKWRRSESHDSALKQARDRFLHDMRQQKLREKPSILSRSKLQRIEKNLRNSFRSFSTDDEFSGDFPENTLRYKLRDSTLRDLASKASKSVRSKFKKTFGLSSTDDSGKIPPQQVNNHIRISDLDSRTIRETVVSTPNLGHKSLSHIPSSLCEPSSNSFIRSCIASTNTKETDSLGENSRVTSWNSTIINTINSKDELSILSEVDQSVNTIKKNDNQIASLSCTNKENLVDHKPQNPVLYPESAAVSSARVYSALMRRLGTKNPQTVFEATQKMSNNSFSSQGFGGKAISPHSEFQESKALPIIRCLSPDTRIKSGTKYRVWRGDAYISESDFKNVDSDDSQNSNKLKKGTKYFGTGACCQLKNEDSNDESNPGRNYITVKDHLMMENSQIKMSPSNEAVNRSHGEPNSSFKSLPETFNTAAKEMGLEEVCTKSCGAKVFRENKSTFFSGGTIVLSKSTSPFRRAMYEGACKSHDASSDQQHRCEMRTPETTDSESKYSRSTGGHVRDMNSSTISLVLERDREKRGQSSTAVLTGGDAIIIERSIYTPKASKRSRHQYISPINSSEWKAWMSTEVAKLNYGKENVQCTTNPDYTSPSSSISRSIYSHHIREDAQINNEDFHTLQPETSNVSLQTSGIPLQQKPKIRKAIPSKLVLEEHSANFNKKSSESTELDPSGLITVPPLTPVFPLRTIQSKSSIKSNNSIKASDSSNRFPSKLMRDPLLKHVKSKTSLKVIRPNYNTMNIENLILHQRFRNKEQRDPILSIKDNDRSKITTSTKSRFRCGPEVGSINTIKADNHHNYEPDWWTVQGLTNNGMINNENNAIDLETVGSKKMVEMFLSSRRKRIASSSCDDTIEAGSSVFL